MGEGSFQELLQVFCTSTHCWDGEAGWLLPVQCSAELDAHIMAMGNVSFLICFVFTNPCVLVLDPLKKMSHFCKHWPSYLVPDVEEAIQTRVC